ncbi:MFS transporter, partial [Frankia sp. AgB32]|uniref:MFS transporter n=1 Tax=Frankia sp. AgB32 TaxID=631119 RepID=UPI00200DEF19
MAATAPAPVPARAGRNELAAALARGPVEVLDFLLPLWAGAALGLAPAAVGALAATETLVSLLARPIAGILADRLDRSRLAAAGAAINAVAFAGYALAGSLGMAMVAAVVGGVGGAVFWIALRARVAAALTADTSAFARLFAAEGTGTWIAFVAALVLLPRVDYRGVFWLGAAACAAAGIALPHRAPGVDGDAARIPRPRALGRRLWPLLGVVALTALAESGVALLLLMDLQRRHGLEPASIALVFLPGFLVYSTAPEFLHSIVTGLGRGRVMVAALVGSAAFTLALAPAPPPWVLAVVWVLAAAAFAAAVPIEQAVVTEAAGVSLGQGMAVYECANLLGMTIGTLGVGLLYGTAGGRALACVLATSLLLTAAALVRPALRRLGVADRPAPGPRLGPDETPAVGAAATVTGPHGFAAGAGSHGRHAVGRLPAGPGAGAGGRAPAAAPPPAARRPADRGGGAPAAGGGGGEV